MFSSVNKTTGELSTIAGTPSDAIQVAYNNASSGLTAGNVQSAIDEVAESKLGINDIPLVKSNEKGIPLYAHRGMSALAPDCSYESWEWARRLGYYGIEIDIQKTSDGVFVCWHDTTLDALSTGTGAVSSHTWAEIQTYVYDAGNNISSYPNLHISSLTELLQWSKRYGVHVLLDVKLDVAEDYTAIAEQIVSTGTISLARVCCGTTAELQAVRNVNQFIPLRLWDREATTWSSLVDTASLWADCDISWSFNDYANADISYAHSKGVKVAFYPNDTTPEYGVQYTWYQLLGLDSATVNTLCNSNDFSGRKVNTFSRFPNTSFGKEPIYASTEYIETSKDDVYNTPGTVYVDNDIGIIHCKVSDSPCIQQAVYLGKGDVVHIRTTSRITASTTVDTDSINREIHSLGYFDSDVTFSATEITPKATSDYVWGATENPTNCFGSNIGLTYDDVHKWRTYETYYIAPQSGLYVVTAGLRSSQESFFADTVYECSEFVVETIQTGGSRPQSTQRRVYLKGLNYSDRVLTGRLHHSWRTLGAIQFEYNWDNLVFRNEDGVRRSYIWAPSEYAAAPYSMGIYSTVTPKYDSGTSYLEFQTAHKEWNLTSPGSSFETSALGIISIFAVI